MARLIIPLLVAALYAAGAGVTSARAEDASYALVIGSRSGGKGQPTLQYAARDAARMAALLVELGRTPSDHVTLLREPSPAQVLQALDDLKVRLSAHARAGERSRVLFYYSGHARARSLSLGDAELQLEVLRRALLALPSTLTVAILDACQSGAISGVKGAHAAADFSVSSVADLKNAGVAVLASSTAAELSQESPELQSSYFTHHLITGLRGAADRDQDGIVSLDEGYGYAYQNALSDTVLTRLGSQHATLETDLKGQGHVPLTYPVDADAQLLLQAPLEGRIAVLQKPRDIVVAELSKARGTALRLALPHGNYEVIVRREGALEAAQCEVTLAQHTLHPFEPSQCRKVPLSSLASKLATGEPLFERWFVETGVARRFWQNDGYIDTLESFLFHESRYSMLSYEASHYTPQFTGGLGLTRNLSLLLRSERLQARSFERWIMGPTTSIQNATVDWATWSVAAGVRARLPLFNERLVPFIEADLGLAIARSNVYSAGESHSEVQYGPMLRGDVGVTVHMGWRMGLYLSGGYDYAWALKNDVGQAHNDGGFHVGMGLRMRGLKGGL
jgi:hypothetical protein